MRPDNKLISSSQGTFDTELRKWLGMLLSLKTTNSAHNVWTHSVWAIPGLGTHYSPSYAHLHQHGVHTVEVRDGVLERGRLEVVVRRQLLQDLGRDVGQTPAAASLGSGGPIGSPCR